jgi:restriction system protein
MGMFGGTVGHFRLDSWVMANLIQLGTQRFCETFLTFKSDPKGRQYDQMTQAARSGVANIAEGSSRGMTSKESEMKLIDVARASFAELQGDYLNWLMKLNQVPWAKHTEMSRLVFSLNLDRAEYGDDILHDACRHVLTQRKKFVQWLDAEDDVVVANTLLIMIERAITMLNRQLESLGKTFREEGGFREKLSVARRQNLAGQEAAPVCPECGASMRKRKAKAGKNAGGEFWGCSKYPQCNGLRNVETK